MVLGKFCPPTTGHCYLVDFARNYVDTLTVVVGTLQRESIPGAQRFAWMKELFPDVNVVHCTDENPQYPHEHPDFWDIWRASLRRFVPEGPDYVFASEDYGFRLAKELGATFVPVDINRRIVPVSATRVREDPMRYWDYLPACVRPWFVRKVCIIGPESTGKSTLARQLAAHFGTVFVDEYARGHIDAHGGEVAPDMFPAFIRGQKASEEALARQANRVLICDSDAFTTTLFHELYAGPCPQWMRDEATRRSYDLYLLTAPDTPFIDDPQRNHPEHRHWFYDRCVEWLESNGRRYVVIRGGWEERFAAAREAVERVVGGD
jgi:HTH-type transcriptional regulator, transcriptional repressor of NAD biosynthesis genes